VVTNLLGRAMREKCVSNLSVFTVACAVILVSACSLTPPVQSAQNTGTITLGGKTGFDLNSPLKYLP
jgi:hypothetical protein